MDTLADELGHPGAQELLRTQSLARLAYNGPDGFPRVIPIGFRWERGRFLMTTAPTSPKVRALATRPQVALSIDTAEPAASNLNPVTRSLLVRGLATVETNDAALDHYIANSIGGLEGQERQAAEAKLRSIHSQMSLISIEPTWARYYDFGAGRLPGFLARIMGE